MEQKEVDLKIKVDDDMTVNLRIPVEIEATTLMGMLEKARRMVKVSLKGETRRLRSETRYSRKIFAPDEAKRFVREYRDAKSKEAKAKVAEKFGIPPEKAISKYNYLHNMKHIG